MRIIHSALTCLSVPFTTFLALHEIAGTRRNEPPCMINTPQLLWTLPTHTFAWIAANAAEEEAAEGRK
jgi:hypothetical protein